jgi:hypothetical protein
VNRRRSLQWILGEIFYPNGLRSWLKNMSFLNEMNKLPYHEAIAMPDEIVVGSFIN